MRRGSGGFTLLEMIVAVAIWMILLAGALQLLSYTTQRSTALLAQQEGFESARIAMDTLIVSLQMADRIILETEASGMLRRLTARQINTNNLDHDFVYYFNSDLAPGSLRFRRLDLGNQELASNILAIYFILSADRDMIHITLISCDILSEPIRLTSTVNIEHKILTKKLV